MDGLFENVFEQLVNKLPSYSPVTVIEVGSWKGLSTTTMAGVLKRYGFDGDGSSIIAIDTWLGAPEFWTWGLETNDPSRSLFLKNGYPSVFYVFTKNVKKLGYENIIAPFPISSAQGADVLTQRQIKADIVYIDASHEYDPALQDIQLYWKLLKVGGVMLGDDYLFPNWPGVIKAVDEFAASVGQVPTISGVVWSLQKKKE